MDQSMDRDRRLGKRSYEDDVQLIGIDEIHEIGGRVPHGNGGVAWE
jgi:hypothetical protein